MSQEQKREGSEWIIVSAPIKPFTANWFIYNFIKSWKPEDLQRLIDTNAKIDLGPIAHLLSDTIERQILEWLKTYRPDLHKVVDTPQGRRWIKQNINRVLKGG